MQTKQEFGLELDILEADKLSYRLHKVRHQGPALKDFVTLQAKADQLIATISYLDQPLRMVEQDAQTAMILLRSETPQLVENNPEYYELKLHQSGLTELDYRSYQRQETEIMNKDMILNQRQLERLGKDLKHLSLA